MFSLLSLRAHARSYFILNNNSFAAPSHPEPKKTGRKRKDRLSVSLVYLILAILFATFLAFSIGTICRIILLSNRGLIQHIYPPRISTETPIGKPTPNHNNELCRVADDAGSDKYLISGGVHQSHQNLYGEAAHLEALVHPSMITHTNPRRVAIIGGGEGILREVLKHNTVRKVVMVGIDKEPEWSNYTDTEGSDADFDDPRESVVLEDIFQFFSEDEVETFDVIIMATLDHDKMDDLRVPDSLFDRLSEDGVFVVQLGESDIINQPEAEAAMNKSNTVIERLENAGFESIHIYDESHSHSQAPYLVVALKDSESRANWYKTSAEIEVELHTRIQRTKSGESTLLFFDAPAMISYQVPSKAQETMYCHKDLPPESCDEYLGIDPEAINAPMSHFEARKSTLGDNAGRGLFATQDIPQYSMFDMNLSVQAFHVLPSTWFAIENFYEWAGDIDQHVFVQDAFSTLVAFIDGYGYKSTLLGKKHYTIDAGITTFCNHGCNGTSNYGEDAESEFTEMNIDLNHVPDAVLNKASEIYSPVTERHLRQIQAIGDYTLRDIKKGEELFCNYLSYVGDPDDWKDEVSSLRGQCTGESIGEITKYEVEH